MVMPNRGGHYNAGHTMRSGIDTLRPDELYLAGQLGAVDAMSRVLAMLEAARPAWHSRGACRGSGLDFTNTKSRPNVAACLELCGRCDVRRECLRWGIEIGDKVSILGGTDPASRRAIVNRKDTAE